MRRLWISGVLLAAALSFPVSVGAQVVVPRGSSPPARQREAPQDRVIVTHGNNAPAPQPKPTLAPPQQPTVQPRPQPTPIPQGHPHDRGRREPWLPPYVVLGVPSVPMYWANGYTSPFPYYTNPYSLPASALNPPQPVVAPDPDPMPPAPAPAKSTVSTTIEQKSKAGKFIGYGDTKFSQQKYFEAADQYRTATQTAGDVPEAFLRHGHALVALGNYENAAKAFRKALAIRSDWSASPLRLDQLYDDANMAKTAHLEALAAAVEENPLDANLLLDLGMELYFDDQRDKAVTFLTRAAQLGGNHDRLLDDLINKPTTDGKTGGKIVF